MKRYLYIGLALLIGAMPLIGASRADARTGMRMTPTAATPTTLTLTGKIVKVDLSGFEPDFDPIDRVVMAVTLHDPRPPALALPDTMLVLSTYLENFQPDTTPVLPDLLHPNQTAQSLGGFMQGKSVLVNAAGRTSYRGSLLAEVFLDNSAHLIVDVDRIGAPATAPSLRLIGALTLYKDLSVRGTVHAERALTAAETAALRVTRGHLPSWQSVVSGLSVRAPAMMGTAGTAGGRRPAQPHSVLGTPQQKATQTKTTTAQRSALPALPPVRAAALGLGVILLIVAALLWRRGVVAERAADRV
jgi:hypothetical protein